jgi:ATP/maltotriose-dependent transcriptional regulator MalT
MRDAAGSSRERVGSWQEIHDRLAAPECVALLAPEELDLLAEAAYLIGHDVESAQAWARAHSEHAARGDTRQAARSAFWLAFTQLNRGEFAQAGGWLARLQRVVEEHGEDCLEHGYVLGFAGMQRMAEGEPEVALTIFGQAAEISRRFTDLDCLTLSQLGQGQALLALGRAVEGCALLDEAMVAVTSEASSPVVTGFVYCAAIALCQQLFDLRRAREWTGALSEWCAAHPELVPYRGQCLVHRAELFQHQGAWSEATDEVRLACDRLAEPTPQPALGAALYLRGELHRLRGELSDAEDAYRSASARGHEPQPGFALLLLARGHIDAAVVAIRRAVEQCPDPGLRSRLQAARVEIALAAGKSAEARIAAEDLGELASRLDSPYLDAVSGRAMGAVLVDDGDAAGACRMLAEALSGFTYVGARYEAARAQILLALAYRELGDLATGELELVAARATLEEIGAGPDVVRVDELRGASATAGPGGLTRRELEVLRLVVEGKTNDEIASVLVVSRHTVRRHVQNIFAKLGVTSRSAATAYAFRHDLA